MLHEHHTVSYIHTAHLPNVEVCLYTQHLSDISGPVKDHGSHTVMLTNGFGCQGTSRDLHMHSVLSTYVYHRDVNFFSQNHSVNAPKASNVGNRRLIFRPSSRTDPYISISNYLALRKCAFPNLPNKLQTKQPRGLSPLCFNSWRKIRVPMQMPNENQRRSNVQSMSLSHSTMHYP